MPPSVSPSVSPSRPRRPGRTPRGRSRPGSSSSSAATFRPRKRRLDLSTKTREYRRDNLVENPRMKRPSPANTVEMLSIFDRSVELIRWTLVSYYQLTEVEAAGAEEDLRA